MRLLTWNIRHGGNTRAFPQVAEIIRVAAPDVVALTEFRSGKSDGLIEQLRAIGLVYVATTAPPKNTNGIALLSRTPVSRQLAPADIMPYRWLEVSPEGHDVSVVGLHIPVAGQGEAQERKRMFWQRVVEFARRRRCDRVILIGDMNTGLPIDSQGTPFIFGEYMEELIALGWTDAWRRIHGPDSREYTWFSSAGNGFRLDYALVSPPLAEHIRDATHMHCAREQGMPDHIPLVVTLC